MASRRGELFAWIGTLDTGCLRSLTLAGGLARSGTTYLEQLVGRHPAIVAFDEFMPLKTPHFAAMLAVLMQSREVERGLWQDAGGRSWRGMTAGQERDALLQAIMGLLATTLPPERLLAQRHAGAIEHLFCKTPGTEFHLVELAQAFSDLPLRYIHCVRDPVACARSNWEMPWNSSVDIDGWLDAFAVTLDHSRKHFESIVAAGIPAHVWRSDAGWDPNRRAACLADLAGFLDVPTETLTGPNGFPAGVATPGVIDHWPASRRRKPAVDFQQVHADALSARTEVAAWRQAFGV